MKIHGQNKKNHTKKLFLFLYKRIVIHNIIFFSQKIFKLILKKYSLLSYGFLIEPL